MKFLSSHQIQQLPSGVTLRFDFHYLSGDKKKKMEQLLRKSGISCKTPASFGASEFSKSKEELLPFNKEEWPFLQDQRFQRNLEVQSLPIHSSIYSHPRSHGLTPSLLES